MIERLLRVVTDVRPGEGPTALLLLANVFLVLCAYYFIKPLREGWIAVSGVPGLAGWEVKAYTSFAQTLILIFVIRWYSHLADRLSRRELLTRSTLFCMSNMVIFWAAQPKLFIETLPFSGFVFYIWIGMFGVFVVAQIFAFAADVYGESVGKRLLPLVAIGATAGGAFGSAVLADVIESEIIPKQYALLAATLPLGLSIWLTRIVDGRHSDDRPEETQAASAAPEAEGSDGINMVFGSRFLLAFAVITLITNWVNTNGENLLFKVLQEMVAGEATELGIAGDAVAQFTRDQTDLFYANFYTVVNSVSLLLQIFIASRLLKYGGFAALLLALPSIALVSYTAMALVPVLGLIRAMKVAENSTDYSINNTARHVLWLPTPTEMKYKAKPAVDTLFARLGDGAAALTVLIGVQALAWPTQTYFVFTVALVVVWLLLCMPVIRARARLVEAAEAGGAGPSGAAPAAAD